MKREYELVLLPKMHVIIDALHFGLKLRLKDVDKSVVAGSISQRNVAGVISAATKPDVFHGSSAREIALFAFVQRQGKDFLAVGKSIFHPITC